MLTLLFILLASISNSIMDVTMFRFNRSIFKTNNEKRNTWWSDRAKRFWIVQLNDAWHFFKMLMIGFLIIAILLYSPIVNIYIDFIIFAIVWNLIFNLFFDIVWRKND